MPTPLNLIFSIDMTNKTNKLTRRKFAKTLGITLGGSFLVSTYGFSLPENIDYLKGKFKPDFESLKQYKCPDWFRDAKFGIFLHWGVNSVPGYNGHYGRYMYWQSKPENPDGTGWNDKITDVYDHHVKTYGHPSKFGYKDFIPLWKAEKFNADKLAKLFQKAGAKYVVPMAVHHDNFDNWDSKYHKWNSVNMGPKIDIIGHWKKACQANNLRFGVSSHFNGGHENVFFQGATDFSGPLAGVPYDSADPKYEDFYHKRSADRKKIVPEFGTQFLARHMDLIDKYEPDLLYFDGGLPYGENGLKVAAHFYNRNMQAHKGELQGVLNLKRGFPEGAATLDIEKGQTDDLRELPWQTDTTINDGWFYISDKNCDAYTSKARKSRKLYLENGLRADPTIRMTADLVIDNLVDIVSKNGNLLLNVGPKADGSISDVFVNELEKIGEWLSINGDAIYETRPWKIFGEGPTLVEEGNFKEPDQPFTSKDIRFTQKNKTLFATCLSIPKTNVEIKALGKDAGLLKEKIERVSLKGYTGNINWKQEKSALNIEFPKNTSLKFAATYEIKWA